MLWWTTTSQGKLKLKASLDSLSPPATALVTAATPDHVTRSGDSGAVLKCTIGAIFLGTPFRGSEARGRKAAEIRYEVALASGKACSPNMHQYLRQGSMHESSELDELITSFQGLINHHDFRFDITCAYETLTTKTSAYEKRLGDKYEEFARERPAEFVVVDHNSARLGGTKELALDARHNMLHKFNSPQDPSFLKIVRRLQEIIEKSHEIMNQKDHIQIFTHHNSQAKEQKQQDQKQEEWQAKCLEALDFDRIDYEPLQLREPGETACEWLIKDPSYSKWYSNGYGIFWILGHAGTGKSTLIKHAIESCVRQTRGGNDQDPTVALSFFFHSQGKLLQRTTEGLFRALFHQLLEKIPKEMKPFADTLDLRKSRLNQVGREDKMSSTNHDGSIWPTPYLMKHFQDSVERVLERLNIRIFVDALNECKDTESNEDVTKEMYNLVIKMQDMAERLRSKPRKFSICFACRHVSQLARLDGDNHVFAQNGNMKDVENYVCQELDREITSDEHRGLRDTLKKKLLQSANGNFLWVTTVVPKILTMYRGGRPDLLAELRKIPRKIEEFYAATVSSLAKETCAMSLKFFQWVCFATRPLEVHDIRFAINIIPDKKYRSFNELPKLFWGSTDEEMKNLVCTLSGGLAEVRNSTVFLIHQSVKDYMMGSGFYRLDPEQYDTQRVLKYGHDLLLTSCLWWSAESSILKAFDYFIASFSQEIIYLAFDSASEDLGGDFDCFPDLSLEDIRGAINNLSDPDRQAIRNFSKPEITHDWNKSLPPEYAKSTESLEFKEWLLVDEVLACLFAWIIIINNTPSVMGYMYAVSNWGDHALQSLVNASESDASDALKAGLDLFFSRADSTHILLHNLVFRTLHSEACLSNPVILRELLKRDVDKRLSLNLKGLEISTQLMSTSDKGMYYRQFTNFFEVRWH
ncbi:hypothetical protein ACHAQK_011307 [Fusarium lateritium]